ncbi:MAG: nitroreductase family deazaflavin-dependent oxidoreductase [Ardenticatenaceae bacterium]|nr:nitroreductase family deazaflavin-dependent oxidoreductase [Ardenticatenaceae bacterium]MCB9446470.1 nitroreductase family deazaflavin-dependent oxidoreductase [Ardenticatenaceae bacterium]
MSDWNKQVIEEFRANEGKVGGHFANMKLLLLHTTGAKSGLPRINPVACMADGNRYVIIASKGGAPTHPDWYHNLIANPQVNVEVGAEQFPALATAAEEPERTELYDKMAAIYPVFDEYRKKTTRKIPLIILNRL